MKFHFARGLVVLGAIAGGCATAMRSASPTPQIVDSPRIVEIHPSVPIAEFRGNPAQIGAEHGRMFSAQINELYEKYLLVELQGSSLAEARLAAASFELYMGADDRQETQSLAEGAGINVYDAMLAQCFLDLMPVAGCSTISLPASASPDGVARFGRNLDFDSLNVLDKNSVLIVYRPWGKYQFATIGWPGMIGAV